MSKSFSPEFLERARKIESTFEATLRRLEPRPGRPRKGTSRPSRVIHVRVPVEVDDRGRRKAKRAHTEPARIIRKLYTKWALS